MKTLILVWYRNDLRLHDHEPLHQALQQQATVLPLYCFDPRQFGETNFGFPKTGAFRARFLQESVAELRQAWRQQGSDLIIRYGYPEAIIPSLVKPLGITAVYCHQEVTAEEVSVETALQKQLALLNIPLRSFWGHTLYHPEDLPFDIHHIPELFTTFRKQIEKQSQIRPTFPPPSSLPPCSPACSQDIDFGELPALSSLQLGSLSVDQPDDQLDDQRAHPPARLHFQGGETSGKARLADYFWQQDRLRVYKETRNGMLNVNDSSKFSAWLAMGCLSPRYIYEQVQQYEQQRIQNDSTYWLVFELLWRDYFRFICAKHGNQIFQAAGLQGVPLPWKQDWPRFRLWQSGQTGYPLVDANMRELLATGFMSNRGRQNVASFLTKNLGIDWRMGAEWFESQLIDYDVCSNWGNWNYTAGVGNDARGFRFFNITKQARDYDPQGGYVKYWLPELAQVPPHRIHEPWKLTGEEQKRFGVRLGVDYPRPIVDLFKSAAAQEKVYQAAFQS